MAEGQEDLPHAIFLRVLLKSSPQILNTRYQIPNNDSRLISLSVKVNPTSHTHFPHPEHNCKLTKQHKKTLSHTNVSYLSSSTGGDRPGSEGQKGNLLAGYLRRGSCGNASSRSLEDSEWDVRMGVSGTLLACLPTMEVG